MTPKASYRQALQSVIFLLMFFIPTFAVANESTATEGCYAKRRVKSFCCTREFEKPEAFEKIYVDCSQILSTPSGIYLKHDNGDIEPMRALLADCKGMYMLRVYTQCPLCGRCYTGKSSPDGYDCPLYDKEIFPGIWTTP